MEEENDLNKVQSDCAKLLVEFSRKVTSKDILEACKIANYEHYQKYKNVESWEKSLSQIRNRDYISGIATKEFLNVLLEIQNRIIIAYDTTIVFSYWSEGAEDNFDSDGLKVAYISLSFNSIDNIDGATCHLIYPNKKLPKKGIVKKLFNEDKLSFQFDNGTAMLMYIGNKNNVRDKFYKGTYISSPHGHISAGAALFQVKRENVTQTMKNERDKGEQDRIATEIYKKRLLALNEVPCFGKVHDLQTKEFYKELSYLKDHYYVRYRKSETDGKIHGDLIKIETSGRVIYKGAQNISEYGRCFIQKSDRYPEAKNLIIEFYQEKDIQKLSFEYRQPNSFLILDIRNLSEVIKGQLLKPRRGYFPHSSKCFLIKVTKSGFDENEFDPSNFESKDALELFSKVEKYHILPESALQDKVKSAFSELSEITF